MFWQAVLLLGSIAYVLHRIYTRNQIKQAYTTFAQRNGCEAPSELRTKSPILHKLSLLRQSYGDLFNDYYRINFATFGPTHAILDSLERPKVIHTINPQNVRAVVLHNQADWGVFTTRRNALKPFAQEGILTTEGHVWQHNRKIIFRSLNTRRSRDTRSVEPHVLALFRSIDGFGEREVVNVSGLLRSMAMDLTSEYMFGISTGIQAESQGKGEIETLFKSWDVVQEFLFLRSIMGSRYWLADGPKFRRACAHFRTFFDAYLTKVQQYTTPPTSCTDRSLAEELIAELKDPIKVREALIEVLIAGQNMVGVTLEWALAELAARPDIYSRLRDEVLSAFGSEDNSERLMTWDSLQTCKTLQNAISETLRLHPLVPLVQRTANKPTVLPTGGGSSGTSPIAVPAGTHLTCNIYLFHRLPSTFGPDPDTFSPDRWNSMKMPVEYMPFGAGARICVGRQMSLMQMSYILARWVQRYERMEGTEGNLVHKLRPILAPREGVRLCLGRVKGGE